MELNDLLAYQNLIHLKCIQPYFNDIWEGIKKFEVRKNDRNFSEGDILALHEISDSEFWPRIIYLQITYLLPGGNFGIDPDYCVIGFNIFPETYQEKADLTNNKNLVFYFKNGDLAVITRENDITFLEQNINKLKSFKSRTPFRKRKEILE